MEMDVALGVFELNSPDALAAAERAVGSEWARAKTEGSGGEGLKGAEKKKKPRIVEV